jgi:hypothetical protein
MSGSYLEVQTLTWEKDTHGLFDYESNSLCKSNFKITGPSSFYRFNSECYLLNDEPRLGSVPLLRIDQKLGEYNANLIQDEPDSSLWLVVKSLKSKFGNGLRLREGDWLKLGRVRLKVQKISSAGEMEYTLAQKCFMQNFTSEVDLQDPGDQSESSPCRICLSEGELPEDPLICPCKCSGTMKFVHVNCLKEWIKNKVSSRVTEKGITVYFKDLSCELCSVSLPTFLYHKGKQISLISISFPNKSFIVLEEYKPENSQRSGLHLVSLDPGQSGVIGRGHDSDIKMSDISVSRKHCSIKLIDKDFFLEDCKSKFGTLTRLNGQLILRYNSELTVQVNRTVFHFLYKEPWSFKKACCCEKSKVSVEAPSYYTQPDVQVSFNEALSNRVTMNGINRESNIEAAN